MVGYSVLGPLVILGALELALCGIWSLARWVHPIPLRPAASPAYQGANWVPELYREQDARLASPYIYAPFTITGVTPWHGRYFNNDVHPTGVWRRTENPQSDGCPQGKSWKVWIFGGSTVYGTGVPDAETIPSYLSRELNAGGNCAEVTNFGNESYVTTQELILLEQQLKQGGRPDVVIFYDGFNDAHLGMTAVDPWATHYGLDIVKARAEGSVRGRLDFLDRLYTTRMVHALGQVFKRTSTSDVRDERARASTVLEVYEANHKMAAALGQGYHFRFYGFWQPMLFSGHKRLGAFEEQISKMDSTSRRRFDPLPVVAAYEEAERRAPNAGFIFLAGIFDSVSEPIYIDEAHLGPRGNELIARAIARYVESPH